MVEVVLARALHDEEEVDEPPHAKPSAGEELEDAEPHLADVDAVDAVATQENGGWGRLRCCQGGPIAFRVVCKSWFDP